MGIIKGVFKFFTVAIVLTVVVIVVAIAVSDGGGKATTHFEEKIHDKVIADAVAQYELVRNHGSKMDRCVHAGIVAAAYVQAKEEAGYVRWSQVEKADCRAAGLR